MITEISTLITSSKAAYDIAKGIYFLKSDVERNKNIAKILEVLVSVQFQASSILSKAHELEIEKHNLTKKIMEFENWSKTEAQYELKEITSGVFIYSYKKINSSSEPMHWLCTKCYNEKRKSILQYRKHLPDGIHYMCNTCNSNYIDHSKLLILQDDCPENKGIPIT